ncbi:MAG: FAD-dependent oxidoreductase [Acidobacteria bacterium]|nr:FAD-dependent oxidoreductase [Acidobacteriota bacterium]
MKLVVVGGVAAGLSAASRARRLDRNADITVLEKGSRISYGACGLPYLIEGQVGSLDELTVYTPAFFENERDIRVRTNSEVVGIQHSRREVTLRSGEKVPYDRLVWAAGARPAMPFAGRNVFCLHTDKDALRLESFLREQRPKTAAVIGGGYIGLELATALRARGLEVSVHHEATTLLNREDDWLSKRVAERLERCRIALHLNTRVNSADSLGADLVVVATGLKPNVELLAEAGAGLGRSGALTVDERMETTLSGIYAAGDCCEARHIVTGRPAWIPLGTTANRMGRVAGANATGARERFEGIAGTAIVRIGGMAVAVTGLSSQQARREGFSPVEVVVEGRNRPKYFHGRKVAIQLVADRNSRRLLGAAIVGDQGVAGRIDVVATALAAKMRPDALAEVDLAYAPPYGTATDPLITAAHQLVKVLD